MSQHVVSVKLYAKVFGALLALTITTVAVSKLDLGAFNVIAAISIAVIKATLVALFFMDVRHATSLTRLVVGAGLFWLAILLLLVLTDYASRGWFPGPHWL